MKASVLFKRNVLLVIGIPVIMTVSVQGQQASNVYEPKIGQKGKDVVWVPTPRELVAKMLEIARVKAGDFVIDLGSGDGRTVISAAKLGAKAEGVEFNHDMVLLSRENAKNEKVTGLVEFIEGDLYNADLSKATVITLFLLPEINLKLRPKLLDLKPGTRVVSNTFTMGGWIPDSTVTTPENWNSWNTAFLWIIPAKVAGIWKLGPKELNLSQEFQFISGLYTENGKSFTVNEGRLRGNSISFIINEEKYSGTVEGDTIRGIKVNSKEGITEDFVARRIETRP